MKTIRLFVSSTFEDMDVERDALRTIVVPHLNACFAGQGLYIQLVDLRHSVETNAALSPEEREKRVFDICVDEIEDCKPFFIGLPADCRGNTSFLCVLSRSQPLVLPH